MNIINSNLSFRSNLSYGNKPDTIVLHHAEASSCSVQDVHQWHLNNGWAGIGYHYFVRKDGSIYTGRPENAIGAHCPGMNSHSIGICAEGAYMSEAMPDVQKQAIIELSVSIKNKYGISVIGGHKEYYSTDCPGSNYPLAEIKSAALSGTIVAVSTPVQAPVQNTVQASSEDESDKEIQRKLNILLKRGLDVDGIPGPLTIAAIKSFQTIMGLTADGIWGPLTDGAAAQIFNRPLDGVPQPHYEYATRYIQFRVGTAIDGTFGNGTKVAVQNWQARHGLGADGIVGAQTWSKLLDENV